MSDRVISVGLLTAYLKDLFDADDLLGDLWIEGEVSEAFRARSGHVYFTLRDDESQLKCALFRANVGRQRYLPRAGDHVTAHGRVTIYERDGGYQLYVDAVQPAGLGIQALQLQLLRQQLESEGLFDPARKRPLPLTPRAIAVVTSPDGAVWHDIQHVLSRRYPFVTLLLAPSAVQGDGAPDGIVAALQAVQRDGRADLVIVARGGGSAEDLWAFNDERVARAIFACTIPVVSGVGHETDWTLVDDVADLRAPTPSAAAEIAVPALTDLQDRLADARARLLRLATLDLDERARDQARRFSALRRVNPHHRIAAHRSTVYDLRNRSTVAHHRGQTAERDRVAAWRELLRALQPQAVLQRGYVALEDKATGRPIFAVQQIAAGDRLTARFVDGNALTCVERTITTPPPTTAPRA